MPTSRRSLLVQAPLAAAVLAAPPEVLGGEPIPLADALRARWAAVRTRTAAGFAGEAPSDGDDHLSGRLGVVVDGLAALDVVKELQGLAPEVQAEPALQALWRDVLGAVGKGSMAAREAAEAWLDGVGQAEDPDGAHLRAVLGAMRGGVGDAETTSERKAMLAASLDELLVDEDGPSLRAQVRRRVRKHKRAERLAALLAIDPAARRRHLHDDRRGDLLLSRGVVPPTDDDPIEGGDVAVTAARVLGVLLVGVLVVLGLYLAVGFLCVGLCMGSVGFLALGLLAIALVTLMIKGAVALARGGRDQPAAGGATAPVRAWPDQVEYRPKHVSLTAPGWVATSVSVEAGDRVIVRALGSVRTPLGWLCEADGDGTAAGPGALLPGAPHVALVGRVGTGMIFFIGAERDFFLSRPGELMVAANLNPGEDLDGAFEIEATRFGADPVERL